MDDHWTGILVLGKWEGEVSGRRARLLQVHSASTGCVFTPRICRPRVAVGLGLQINTDNQKNLSTEITDGVIAPVPEPAEIGLDSDRSRWTGKHLEYSRTLNTLAGQVQP